MGYDLAPRITGRYYYQATLVQVAPCGVPVELHGGNVSPLDR